MTDPCADLRLQPTEWVCLFPLPNVVLLPHSVVPLHVFEPRYREMARDALQGSRLIAVALLKPGFEASYHQLDAPIHSMIGVGRILREERLEDGRLNILLQGLTRAKIVREDRSRSYRQVCVETIHSEILQPDAEVECRRKLKCLLGDPVLKAVADQGHWTKLFACPDLRFSDLVDVLASVALTGCAEKQEFLCEPRVGPRFEYLCAALEMIKTELIRGSRELKPDRGWPPRIFEN